MQIRLCHILKPGIYVHGMDEINIDVGPHWFGHAPCSALYATFGAPVMNATYPYMEQYTLAKTDCKWRVHDNC